MKSLNRKQKKKIYENLLLPMAHFLATICPMRGAVGYRFPGYWICRKMSGIFPLVRGVESIYYSPLKTSKRWIYLRDLGWSRRLRLNAGCKEQKNHARPVAAGGRKLVIVLADFLLAQAACVRHPRWHLQCIAGHCFLRCSCVLCQGKPF